MTSNERTPFGWAFVESTGRFEFRWQLEGVISSSLERQNSVSSHSSASTQTSTDVKVTKPSWKPGQVVGDQRTCLLPAGDQQDLFGIGAQLQSELHNHRTGHRSSENRQAVDASHARSLLPPTALIAGCGTGSLPRLTAGSSHTHAEDSIDHQPEARGWVSPYPLWQRIQRLSLQIESASGSFEDSKPGRIVHDACRIPTTPAPESLVSREDVGLGKLGSKGYCVPRLHTLPRADPPVAELPPGPERHRTAVVDPTDASNHTASEPLFQLDNGVRVFQTGHAVSTSLPCPICKLGLTLKGCAAASKKSYTRWLSFKEGRRLTAHEKAGHVSSEQLRDIKALGSSPGLPKVRSTTLADVAKYFRRVMTIIVPGLKPFEDNLNPYERPPLRNGQELGTDYANFRAAILSFLEPKRHQRGTIEIASSPEDDLYDQDPYGAGDLPHAEPRLQAAAGHAPPQIYEPSVAVPHPMLPADNASATSMEGTALGDDETGWQDNAEISKIHSASGDVGTLLEAFKYIQKAATLLSGPLPGVAKELKRLGEDTFSEAQQVNHSHIHQPTQPNLHSGVQGSTPYSIVTPNPRKRARRSEPQHAATRAPGHAGRFFDHGVDSSTSLRRQNQLNSSQKPTSNTRDGLQHHVQSTTSSRPSNTYSGETVVTETQAEDQNPSFTKPPYSAQPHDELGNAANMNLYFAAPDPSLGATSPVPIVPPGLDSYLDMPPSFFEEFTHTALEGDDQAGPIHNVQ